MDFPERILILGGTGMLGHKLAQVLSPLAEVTVTVRGSADHWPASIPVAHVAEKIDVRKTAHLLNALDTYRPQAVINAVGVVKQVLGAHDPEDIVAVNALYPRILADLCAASSLRLIHYSTDCVYSGSAESARGPLGYREIDAPDSRDLYGMTKLLGEPAAAGCMVLRTSIIGRELRGRNSLLEWFLASGEGPVKGFSRALFTGLPTLELARVTAKLLTDHSKMDGLWHVSAPPIDKNALLGLIKVAFRRKTQIQPHDDFFCDRRLDGSRFAQRTNWTVPAWPDMIDALCEDAQNDESLYRVGVE